MKKPYRSIEEMLWSIDEPNQTGCLKLLTDNRKLFQESHGSVHNHQNWPGGYYDHIEEVMNIAFLIYSEFDLRRTLPFSLSDLFLVVFLHDIEKPWKYDLREDGQLYHKQNMLTKEDHQKFRMEKLAEYGIVLTPEQENGIKYAEGELADYSPRGRVMSPLAAMAHMCDVASARIWFAHPLEKNDPWLGTEGRIRD